MRHYLFLVIVLFTGCASAPQQQSEIVRPQIEFGAALPDFPDATVGRMRQWHQELDKGGEVIINNPFGDVYVRHNRGGNRVGISGSVQRLGNDPFLESITINARPNRVALNVDFPDDGRPHASHSYGRRGRVDLVVLVPEGSTLRIRTREGLASGKRIRANLDVATESGDISFSSSGSIKARSNSGNVLAVMSGTSWSGITDLSSDSGSVAVEFRADVPAILDLRSGGSLVTEPPSIGESLAHRAGRWKGSWGQPSPAQNRILMRSKTGDLKVSIYGMAADYQQAR